MTAHSLRLLGACFLVQAALAQVSPVAPIRDFSYPSLNPRGYLAWELTGGEGHYLDESTARVVDVDLRVFSGDSLSLVERRIQSPEATIHFRESRAEGRSSLRVEGPGFVLSGRDWSWDGDAEKIEVRDSVQVIFEGKLEVLR